MRQYLLLTLSILFSAIIIAVSPLATQTKPFLPHLNYLLGIDKPTSYVVLLGNDTEMRANGGFAGSYAKMTLQSVIPTGVEGSPSILALPKLKINPEISFQDIYVPNGQLDGYVTPPTPIQQAFGKGSWELANADWEPDFPTSAKSLRWFFEKGGEINPDNLAIINLSTIKKVLNVIGPISVSEYSAQITPENFYLFLQGKAEVGFFPGSTQKKDALSAVGKALIDKFNSLPINRKLQIAQIFYNDFLNQNILLHSSNESLQQTLEANKLAGVLSPEAFDTYSFVETNLGANKANQFVTRQTTHDITHTPGFIHHQVKITFHNYSPEANPNPPIHYGGNYIAYLRFYIPTIAQNITTSGENLNHYRNLDPGIVSASTSAKFGLTEIGFWHTTLAGSNSSLLLSYDLPLENKKDYSMAILKQNGLVSSPQTINLFGHRYDTSLNTDFLLP